MQETKQKIPFWRNKARLGVFLLGCGFITFSVSQLAIDSFLTNNWVETEITRSEVTDRRCPKGRGDITPSDWIYTHYYVVNGKEYSITECVNGSNTPIGVAYNPDNPAQATGRTFATLQALAVVALIPGALMTIGSVFATAPKNSTL